jgi:hypothetical protein
MNNWYYGVWLTGVCMGFGLGMLVYKDYTSYIISSGLGIITLLGIMVLRHLRGR